MSRWRKLLGRIEAADEQEDDDAAVEEVFGPPPQRRAPASPEHLARLIGQVDVALSDGVADITLRVEALAARSAQYYGRAVLAGEEPLVDAILERPALRYQVAPGAEIAAFESGVGDGVYPIWIGRDRSGAAVAVMTSFDIIPADAASRH